VKERSPLANSAFDLIAENHNVKSASDIKKGLESPPGIVGTSVAECKIDQSAMSGSAANNKIPGITKYNNFSLTSKSMRVWQAYNVVEVMDIEGSWNEQDVSGLERIGDWENTMPVSLSVLLAALNLLVLPPSKRSKKGISTWTQVSIL